MSKFLNRIAPQDKVLLEVDVGRTIPSAEQLAEERVTRFNADKEIRLRVKALEETSSGPAIQEAKAAAVQARDDAVVAKGQAEGFAKDASTSASNASTSAINAKTSENNAKTTADGLSAGLATLNSFDGRVGTLETQVAPTLAGGLLDVQLGHNAMVKVCKANMTRLKALATQYGVPYSTINAYLRCAGINNYWFVWVTSVDLIHVCDTSLNYKFSIDVSLTTDQQNVLGNASIRGTLDVYQGFKGKGLAVTPDGKRLYMVTVGYTTTAATAPIQAYLRSWDLTTGALLKANFVPLRSDYGGTFSNDFVNIAYLSNAKLLLVGGEFLFDPDTLEAKGTIADATTTTSNAKAIATAQVAYGKKVGHGTTFTGTQVVVINRWDGGPVYVDDLTDPTTPTLRNFVDANGNAVTAGFSGFACAELTGTWANHQTYFLRVANGKLAWRNVVWTFPSDTAEMKAVVGAETVSQISMTAYANVICSQGHFNGSKNQNKPLCYISYPGSILHMATTLNETAAIPAVDTMNDLGSIAKDRNSTWFSPQTNYGYLIPQSGSNSWLSNFSVILTRLVVR